MGRKGRFRTSYDANPIQRLLSDNAHIDALHQAATSALEQAVHQVADEVSEEHGVATAEARLLVSQLMFEDADFLRWVKAGQARTTGIPGRGIAAAMGYSSMTSITRMIATIDMVAEAQARVNTTGTPERVDSEEGSSVLLTPNGGADEAEAARRGWTDAA